MARTELPSSVDALRDLVVEQQRLIDEQAEKIAYLEEWKRLIDSQRFGSKSEKASPDQFPLFNEAEVEAAATLTRRKRTRSPSPRTRGRSEAGGLYLSSSPCGRSCTTSPTRRRSARTTRRTR